ncbi:MAG: hypothetical protein HAW64_01795 [Alphaproteobacteria bacterium]|nr:hypothetical protein [Alphaproteobacteria bacterium]
MFSQVVAVIIFVCVLLLNPIIAEAGAWLPKKGERKIITKYNTYEYTNNFLAINYDAEDYDTYIEYGLHKKYATTFKYLQSRSEVNGRAFAESNFFEITVKRTTPLKNGLLPPFTQTIAQYILKLAKIEKKIIREKSSAVSLHFLFNSNNNTIGYGASLAFGDKISIGRWHLTQEAEYREFLFNKARWQGAVYRAQLGYGGLAFGQETDYFHDHKNNYRSLTQMYYVAYDVPRLPLILRFGKGEQRFGLAPPSLPNIAFTARGDYMRFEVEYKF